MADFKIAFEITNGNEGGWQNDPNDTGNDALGHGTYRGIASAKQPRWCGWAIIRRAIARQAPQPQYGTKLYREWVHKLNDVLAADESLQQMVEEFFRVNYWEANRLGEFSSQTLANKVYDCGVNQGVQTAAKILQRCLGVEADGCIGPITLSAANERDGTEVAETFRARRVQYYQDLVKAHPHYAQYLQGWIGRC